MMPVQSTASVPTSISDEQRTLTGSHCVSAAVADDLELFLQASELVIDSRHSVGNFFFVFLVRYLRIFARKLPILIRQISNQAVQFGC